jgi:hypothetical protein
MSFSRDEVSQAEGQNMNEAAQRETRGARREGLVDCIGLWVGGQRCHVHS